MTEYILYKKKEFKLQKEAREWLQKEKKSYGGTKPVRIETNYNPSNPLPWEGAVFLKGDV